MSALSPANRHWPPMARRRLGRTSVHVTEVGLGTAPLGGMAKAIDDVDAIRIIRTAIDCGVRLFDSAPWYGRGLSELRLGAGLRTAVSDQVIVSTKIGRWLRAPDAGGVDPAPWQYGNRFDAVFDYSYDGIMRAYDQSCQRLGRESYDLAVVHDLDAATHGSRESVARFERQLRTSGWRALDELVAAGRLRAVGAGVNHPGLASRWVTSYRFDFFLVAMGWTLLDQSVLVHEGPVIERHGVGVIVGAPFGSGILATGPTSSATYAYRLPAPDVRARVRRLNTVCRRHGVTLRQAALQFPLTHPNVAAVIPGAMTTAQVRENATLCREPVPSDLWVELKQQGLLSASIPIPDCAPVSR